MWFLTCGGECCGFFFFFFFLAALKGLEESFSPEHCKHSIEANCGQLYAILADWWEGLEGSSQAWLVVSNWLQTHTNTHACMKRHVCGYMQVTRTWQLTGGCNMPRPSFPPSFLPSSISPSLGQHWLIIYAGCCREAGRPLFVVCVALNKDWIYSNSPFLLLLLLFSSSSSSTSPPPSSTLLRPLAPAHSYKTLQT